MGQRFMRLKESAPTQSKGLMIFLRVLRKFHRREKIVRAAISKKNIMGGCVGKRHPPVIKKGKLEKDLSEGSTKRSG